MNNMHNWKLWATALAAILLVVLVVGCAQDRRRGYRPDRAKGLDPSQPFEQYMGQLKRSLLLSPKQETKVRPIIKDDLAKRKALMETSQDADRGQRDGKMRSEMQKLQLDTETKLSQVLSKTQMKRYQTLLEQQQRGRGPGGPGGPGGMGGRGRF